MIDIFIMAYTLFLLMDSIGNVPLFIAVLKNVSPERQKWIIFRELVIALGIMILFVYIGNPLLRTLNISHYALLVSGGIILFILSLKMIFPSGKDADLDRSPAKEPLIFPLAIPFVAGPATLAMIMLYARQEESPIRVVAALLMAWAISTVILVASSFLKKILGLRGIIACERLVGLLLTMMAVQMFFEGMTQYLYAQP